MRAINFYFLILISSLFFSCENGSSGKSKADSSGVRIVVTLPDPPPVDPEEYHFTDPRFILEEYRSRFIREKPVLKFDKGIMAREFKEDSVHAVLGRGKLRCIPGQ